MHALELHQQPIFGAPNVSVVNIDNGFGAACLAD